MTFRALAAAVVLSVVLATAVSASSPRSAEPEGVLRVERFYAKGPSASYEGDAGGLGGVPPLTVSVPTTGERWDAVVNVTFQYTATGKGPWITGVDVSPAAGGTSVAVKPKKYSLGGTGAGRPDSATVRYLVRDLRAGRDYLVSPQVNSFFVGPTGRSKISSSKVVLTVELTPR